MACGCRGDRVEVGRHGEFTSHRWIRYWSTHKEVAHGADIDKHGTARGADAETLARVAPGTGLRDGLERILRGRTGALIVLGHDEEVEKICDGVSARCRVRPTRLRELAKMDGAVVLSTDGERILRANVQPVPDPTIPTDESGTRHRAAERTAVQTDIR